MTAVATATPIPNGSLNQHSDSRPTYPGQRAMHYPTSVTSSGGRAHVTVDISNPPSDSAYSQGSYDSRSSLIHAPPPPPPVMLANSGQPPPHAVPAASEAKRNAQLGHPLKSFTVPAPPPQTAPPMKIVSPIVSSAHRQAATVNPTPNAQSSPYKKAGGTVASPLLGHKGGSRTDAAKPIQHSYSTEELNQEMANLEGLMKDLNAITANDFGC